MTFEGQAVQVLPLDGGFVELRLDKNDSVNALDRRRVASWSGPSRAWRPRRLARAADHERQGRVHRSARTSRSSCPSSTRASRTIAGFLLETARRSSRRSRTSRPPSVAAINGVALGGGFELCLCGELPGDVERGEGRPARDEARHLPGLGRHRAAAAPVRRRHGDRVDRLGRAVGRGGGAEGGRGGRGRRAGRPARGGARDAEGGGRGQARLARAPRGEEGARSSSTAIEAGMVFLGGKASSRGKAGPALPGARSPRSSRSRRARARRATRRWRSRPPLCAKLAKTETARSLVGVFLGDQAVKRIARRGRRRRRGR